MCDFSKGLKLCSCGNEKIKFRKQEYYRKVNDQLVKVPKKENENIPLVYIWQLFKYAGPVNDGMMGLYELPKNDIGNGLNAEWIALNLNILDCFDFDYEPGEGDNLFITQNEYGSPYISFIFKSGKWIIDHYYVFGHDVEHVRDGLVKEIDETE